ncbi:MAG: hypothetical protein EP318_13920 [Rhodobacteraceae bacterium]|nr:MAG: hypothetical protein EP318_13920 [Paracoccaceae bacterium]
MSLFSKLFGGGSKQADPGPDPVEYEGFVIHPTPVKQSGGYRIGARIEKEIGGEVKDYELIRADVVSDADEAAQMSVRKAEQMIREQGEKLFD